MARPGSITVDVHLDPADWSGHLAEETRRGLRDDPPWIPPVWFYDEAGSKLFDQITRLEEYYPTDAERSILREHADDIAGVTGAETLIELGSGTSEKTTLLIDALSRAGTLQRFAPFDVSEEVLRASADTVAATWPGIDVHAVVGDFHQHLDRVPTDGVAILAFLGSTIGNLDPDRRRVFLGQVRGALDADDWLLLGTDLVKDPGRLVRAYDDADGVTAAFNLNSLTVMNRELDADFDPGGFSHRSHWDPEGRRIEMHLVATSDQTAHLAGLGGLTVTVRRGDFLRTEISTKFTPQGVADELAAADLAVERQWFDDAGDFLVTLARPT
jgi:L-histidine N-alpha-methyltransferase